jgi:hypothetical protein
VIEPEEMVYWELKSNGVHTTAKRPPQIIKSAAISSIIHTRGWEVLGGYQDSCVADGALIMEAKYGKGLYFWTQLLFPEVKPPDGDRALAFWDKFTGNIMSRFEVFKRNGNVPAVEISSGRGCAQLPKKRNYRMISHIHSRDWWGAGSSPATLNAAMRYLGMDIALLSANNAFAFGRPVLENLDQYSDERVLLVPGEEFHPFNWEPGAKLPNSFHILSKGTNAYSRKFRAGLFDREEIDRYVKGAIAHIRSNGGIACATHVTDDYWTEYDFDEVDLGARMLRGLAGTELERVWCAGRRISCSICLDMWGIQILKKYPAFIFTYVDGVPSKESVLAAIRKGHMMPALRMAEAHVALGHYLPGDILSVSEARALQLTISVRSQMPMDTIKVFSGERVVFEGRIQGMTYDNRVEMKDLDLRTFIRLEVIGADCMLITNPFYLTKELYHQNARETEAFL